ncbi:MAG: chaperone modulatory protein CbpM [Cellvibrionales bacterium]|nr:chaperone modulatory protein CbpM [Cellvibrionales bacterium]
MITLTEVCQITINQEEDILLIVEEGIVSPKTQQTGQPAFQEQDLMVIKKACRLHKELNLDWHAVALMMDLLDARDALERENAALRQRLERFLDF